MGKVTKVTSVSRRGFLATTGSLIATAPALGRGVAPASGETPLPRPATSAPPKPARSIPISVFDIVYSRLDIPTDQMIEKISAMGLEAVEVASGGQNKADHCPLDELVADPAKAKAWKKKFTDRNLMVAALSCQGNMLHPDPAISAKHDKDFRNSIVLAERLEIPVVITFGGQPGATLQDTAPNWKITYGFDRKLLDWQWDQKVIPYWKELIKFARAHNCKKIAIEMHPNDSAYNPKMLLKLREAIGEEIGANCDLSHLMWQGCEGVPTIQYLQKQGAIYHAHMKDQVVLRDTAAKTGMLNSPPSLSALRQPGAEYSFFNCAVGYGHGAHFWKEIVKAYMDTGFQGVMSIEIEDPFLPGKVAIERSLYVLKNVRAELLAESA